MRTMLPHPVSSAKEFPIQLRMPSGSIVDDRPATFWDSLDCRPLRIVSNPGIAVAASATSRGQMTSARRLLLALGTSARNGPPPWVPSAGVHSRSYATPVRLASTCLARPSNK
jgi:hypothetical protein